MKRSTRQPLARLFVAATFVALLAATASAQTVTWPFDIETAGQDVYHSTTTAVCNIAPLYEGTYEISLVEAEVSYAGFTFGPFDVTDQIPEENLSGTDTQDGPPPVTIVNQHVQYPEPPATPSIAADLSVTVDAAGYGQVAAENLVLGQMSIDVGFPFGVVTVQLESVRVAGTVWATPILTGDLDGDFDIDLADLQILLSNYGSTGATPQQGDLTGDTLIDLADLQMLLSAYGLSC